MKFSCGRCGKKYATAETPAPGRVYKIRCKACGHLIVVKASAAGQQTATTELRAPTSTDLQAVSPTPPPGAVTSPDGQGVALEIAPPEPHAESPSAPGEASPAAPPLQDPPPAPADGVPAGVAHEPTQEISATALAAALQPAQTPAPTFAPEPSSVPQPDAQLASEPPTSEPPPTWEPPPPSDPPGYVDLFGDPAKPDAEPEKPREDAFAAAARSSLPDGYGQNGTAPDPFAPLRDELTTPPPEPLPDTAKPAAAKVPVIAKPAQQKSSGPIVLIGLGALVLVGILAFVLLGGHGAPVPPPARPIAAAPPPVPAPAAPPAAVAAAPTLAAAPTPAVEAPPPPAQPAAAAAAPALASTPEPEPAAAQPAAPPPAREQRPSAADERRAREERRARDREAKAAKAREEREAKQRAKAAREAKAREEREAKQRAKAAREAKAREEREASQRAKQQQLAATELDAPGADALSPQQVQKVITSSRKAFDTCIAGAAKSGVLDGRRVLLQLNIQPSGAVTYPTLDDVTLNGTDLGSCLKSAARVMVFPKFQGDPMHVEVPLVLAAGR